MPIEAFVSTGIAEPPVAVWPLAPTDDSCVQRDEAVLGAFHQAQEARPIGGELRSITYRTEGIAHRSITD
jgi:hypothetical protein